MRRLLLAAVVVAIAVLTAANAEITNVSAGLSSAGTAPAILATPPTDVLNNTVTNTGQQGFNEAKVVTTVAHAIDGGSIPAGILVNSHMIFLNAPDGDPETVTHTGVEWTFSQPILGVMKDSMGQQEADSTFELGAPGTNYTVPVDQAAPFTARGMEGGDSTSIAGNVLTVTMQVVQPGDWIRVVTCAQGSQGFWRNNPEAWPVDSITIGGVLYTKAAAIAYMKAPTKGNKALTIFPQIVAAKLNVMTAGDGCLPDCIQATIDDADAWMETYVPGGLAVQVGKVKANSPAWEAGEPLYETLDSYNNEELECPD